MRNKDRYAAPGFTGDRHTGKRVGTIWRKADSGDVTISMDFDDLLIVQKLDIIKDVRGLLEREYIDLMAHLRSGKP